MKNILKKHKKRKELIKKWDIFELPLKAVKMSKRLSSFDNFSYEQMRMILNLYKEEENYPEFNYSYLVTFVMREEYISETDKLSEESVVFLHECAKILEINKPDLIDDLIGYANGDLSKESNIWWCLECFVKRS